MLCTTLCAQPSAHNRPATEHAALKVVGAWAFPPQGNGTKMLAMASRTRVLEAWRAVQHVAALNVPGDIVEAGVFRGGTMMVMAWSEIMVASRFGKYRRTLWLYDTFEGLPPPTTEDGKNVNRRWSAAAARLRPGASADEKGTATPYIDAGWCYALVLWRGKRGSPEHEHDRLHHTACASSKARLRIPSR